MQLASFGTPRAPGAPDPIRVAGASGADEPEFPQMVSPLTGEPIDPALLEAEGDRLAAARTRDGAMRIPLAARGAQ